MKRRMSAKRGREWTKFWKGYTLPSNRMLEEDLLRLIKSDIDRPQMDTRFEECTLPNDKMLPEDQLRLRITSSKNL